jgi:predicted RNase H-like HicB family nuclease
MQYTVIFEHEADGGYHATVPVLSGCHSQGETLDEAVANITEAICVYIESLRAHGEAVPADDLLIMQVDVC